MYWQEKKIKKEKKKRFVPEIVPRRQRALAQQTSGPNLVGGRRTRDAMPAPVVARRSSCFVRLVCVRRCGFVYLFRTFSRAYRRRCRRVRPRVWADPTCSDPVARAYPLPVNGLSGFLDKIASVFFFVPTKFALRIFDAFTHFYRVRALFPPSTRPLPSAISQHDRRFPTTEIRRSRAAAAVGVGTGRQRYGLVFNRCVIIICRYQYVPFIKSTKFVSDIRTMAWHSR